MELNTLYWIIYYVDNYFIDNFIPKDPRERVIAPIQCLFLGLHHLVWKLACPIRNYFPVREVRGANDLHMIQLMPLLPRHLLLH